MNTKTMSTKVWWKFSSNVLFTNI